MARIMHVALAVAVIAIAAIVILVAVLPSYMQPAVRPEVPPEIARLNTTAVVVGPEDFAGGIVEKLSDRVGKVFVYSGLSPEILRYADRSTVLVLSSDWLEENAGRGEIKEMIRVFIENGSMIYVNGTKAGVFQKMLYEILYEKGVESGAPQAALQELSKRMESIPEENRAGIGYMKVSEKHEVLVFGSLEDALKTLAEYNSC